MLSVANGGRKEINHEAAPTCQERVGHTACTKGEEMEGGKQGLGLSVKVKLTELAKGLDAE